MATALIVQGGWDGHEPGPISQLLAGWLREAGFTVEVADTLDAFADEAKLKQLDLLVPIWTMGNIKPEQLNPLLNAVRGGVGIAGLHGGMGDAFRNETEYQFMVGGQWVAHPGGIVTYTVNIRETSSPIMEGVTDFEITSEQYYMRRSANEVLATDASPSTMPSCRWSGPSTMARAPSPLRRPCGRTWRSRNCGGSDAWNAWARGP